jgi:hypothetical protein
MPAADLIIRNATLVDGTGGPAQPGDLSVYGDRIVEVGRVGGTAAREIDAEGLVLAPGFIDAHTHDDNALLVAPDMIPKISQGVTTVIVGNPGSRTQDEAANRAANARLQAELAPWRHLPHEGVGDGGWREEGFFVLDLPDGTAVELARRFGQVAIVAVRRAEPARLAFTGVAPAE